jgi:Zinc-binding dehydrogenase
MMTARLYGPSRVVAIEAVGIPETFELCTELVRPGGRVANVGVHGHPATLHLERLWIRNITITTGLVDTTWWGCSSSGAIRPSSRPGQLGPGGGEPVAEHGGQDGEPAAGEQEQRDQGLLAGVVGDGVHGQRVWQ